MNDLCLVLTSCSSEDTARAMAQELLDRKLAASVSLVPLQTFYRFDSQTLEEVEVQLQVTTLALHYPDVEACILRLHTYEVPDIVMVPVQGCPEVTRNWVAASTRSRA